MENRKLMVVLICAGIAFVVLVAAGLMTGFTVGASSVCNNSVCEVGENPGNCPEDCVAICGDQICYEGENLTCRVDCVGASEELPMGIRIAGKGAVFEWIGGWFD